MSNGEVPVPPEKPAPAAKLRVAAVTDRVAKPNVCEPLVTARDSRR